MAIASVAVVDASQAGSDHLGFNSNYPIRVYYYHWECEVGFSHSFLIVVVLEFAFELLLNISALAVLAVLPLLPLLLLLLFTGGHFGRWIVIS